MNDQVAANPLGTERVGKLMIRYAIPSIISIVVNSLFPGAALRVVRGHGGKSPLCTGLRPYYCAGLSLLRGLLRLRERNPGGRASQSQHDWLAHRLCHKYHFRPDLHFCVPVGRQRRRLGHHSWADFECRLFCRLSVPV